MLMIRSVTLQRLVLVGLNTLKDTTWVVFHRLVLVFHDTTGNAQSYSTDCFVSRLNTLNDIS